MVERTPRPSTADNERSSKARGFTLIELIIVVAIIAILATIALPAMRNAPLRAKEAVLKEDLFTMRSCIDQYLADKGRYPPSLEVLVDEGYLRFVPMDPIAETTAWIVEEVPTDAEEDLQPLDDEGGGAGIWNVRSSSEKIALDGTAYAEW